MQKTTVYLRLGTSDTEEKIGWYGQVSDDHVQSLIRRALLIPTGTEICATCEGSLVALNCSIPNNTKLHIETAYSTPSRGFRRQLIKFENIQAHLANERTFLAWIRTSLASLSISFSMLALVADASKDWLAASLYILGAAFVVSVFTTFLTGWLRFARIRDILMLTPNEVPVNFHRLGLSHQAYFVAILCALVTFLYLTGGPYLALV